MLLFMKSIEEALNILSEHHVGVANNNKKIHFLSQRFIKSIGLWNFFYAGNTPAIPKIQIQPSPFIGFVVCYFMFELFNMFKFEWRHGFPDDWLRVCTI